MLLLYFQFLNLVVNIVVYGFDHCSLKSDLLTFKYKHIENVKIVTINTLNTIIYINTQIY